MTLSIKPRRPRVIYRPDARTPDHWHRYSDALSMAKSKALRKLLIEDDRITAFIAPFTADPTYAAWIENEIRVEGRTETELARALKKKLRE
jgi:hypothetical protein